MNIAVKILGSIIRAINRTIDGMDKRAVQNIKQGFYFAVFMGVVLAITFGYLSGKKSARRGGKPLAENTNAAFDIDVKREQENGRFRSMLDSDLIRKLDGGEMQKFKYPSREDLEPEVKNQILEPRLTRKKKEVPEEMDLRDKVGEIDKTDFKPRDAEVRRLNRRERYIESNPDDVIRDKATRERSIKDDSTTAGDDSGSQKSDIRLKKKNLRVQPDEKAGDDEKLDGAGGMIHKKRPIKKSKRDIRDLQPMDKDSGVLK